MSTMTRTPAEERTDDAAEMPVPPVARRRLRFSPRFWVCVVLLGVSAAAVQVVPPMIGATLRKDPVNLRKELHLFNAHRLAPRYERHPDSDRIPPLSEDLIQSLGTRKYLQLYLTDTTVERTDPTRVGHLFLTYYTGKPDMVPHVPDECYLAGGYDLIASENLELEIPGVGAKNDRVPVRVLQFEASEERRALGSDRGVLTVLYFFHANGKYATTRNGVRLIMTNPFERYAYYMKVEVMYPGTSRLKRDAAKERSLRAFEDLMAVLMPVLIEDHLDLSEFSESPPIAPGTE